MGFDLRGVEGARVSGVWGLGCLFFLVSVGIQNSCVNLVHQETILCKV